MQSTMVYLLFPSFTLDIYTVNILIISYQVSPTTRLLYRVACSYEVARMQGYKKTIVRNWYSLVNDG